MVPEEVTTLKVAGAVPGLVTSRTPADTVWAAPLLLDDPSGLLRRYQGGLSVGPQCPARVGR
jgi:hypothetical protein